MACLHLLLQPDGSRTSVMQRTSRACTTPRRLYLAQKMFARCSQRAENLRASNHVLFWLCHNHESVCITRACVFEWVRKHGASLQQTSAWRCIHGSVEGKNRATVSLPLACVYSSGTHGIHNRPAVMTCRRVGALSVMAAKASLARAPVTRTTPATCRAAWCAANSSAACMTDRQKVIVWSERDEVARDSIQGR